VSKGVGMGQRNRYEIDITLISGPAFNTLDSYLRRSFMKATVYSISYSEWGMNLKSKYTICCFG